MAGQLLIAILVGLTIFMMGVTVISFIEDTITDARIDNSCSSPASDGNKALCLILDITIPYFILVILSIAGGLITERLLV